MIAVRKIGLSLLLLAILAFPALLSSGRAFAATTTPAEPPIAQSTGNGSPTPAHSTQNGDNAAGVGCPTQNALAKLDEHAALQILPSTRWQPYDGDVQFELTGVGGQLSQVAVYFAWPAAAGKPAACVASLRVRLLPRLDADDDGTYRYAARFPYLDNGSLINGIDHWDLASTVPLADMYVVGTDPATPTPLVFISTVGVSTPWLAFVGAIGCGIAVWAVLAYWTYRRKIPGGPFLGIISSPNGVASLSQFQILIWTYVIGVGVIYVMMISGNLIDIPTSTLGLLGITGFALVGSKLTSGSDGSPQQVSPPGAVTGLTIVGTPTADTVVLTWSPPAATSQPFGYTIQWRVAGTAMWTSAAHGIAGPPYAVIALAPGTQYDFQVFATNAGGAGPTSVPASAPTNAVVGAAVVGAAVAGPPQVTGVTAATQKNGTIQVHWATLSPAPDGYIVQYRRTGELPWSTFNANANPPAYVDQLDGGSSYQFQVFAQTAGNHGSPSTLVEAKTLPRQPQWSDLVMSGDKSTEVDLSRLQMLVFTTITAVFTAITLTNTGVIPDLPIGELALVGISNGVYLATKVSK